jgi:hypothetical protein
MIQFSYEDILERLKSNLQKRLENTGLLFYSTNQRILEAIAEELSELTRYDEYLMRESKWEIASNLSSIMTQTEFFNYQPHKKIGAFGSIRVSGSENFTGSYPRSVPIPKFTQFTNGDISFSSTQSVTLFPSQTYLDIPVIQGEVKTSIFEITRAYSESELIDLVLQEDNENIENSLYEVRVNGELWTEINSFSLSIEKDAKVYTLKIKPDFSGVFLGFGDGLTSKKLEYDDTVTFKYLETLGSTGEILQTNLVTQIVSSLKDSSNQVARLYCTNTSPITGGEDYESLKSIKENAPLSLNLSSRVITANDFQSFILGTGKADKVTVWGETEYNLDRNLPQGTFISSMENLINVSALNYSEELITLPLSPGEKDSIRDSLVEVKSLTDIINFIDPKITFLHFNVLAYYDANLYSQEQAIFAVTNEITDNYSIEQNNFKQSLYLSQYYELINSLPEVEYHTTDLTMIQYIENLENDGSVYRFILETNHRFLFKGSVKIYVKNINSELSPSHPHFDWFLVGTDDENGQFIGEDVPSELEVSSGETYEITPEILGTELLYSVGAFADAIGETHNLQITNGMIENDVLNYRVKIEFKAGSGTNVDVVPTLRNQIFAYESVSVETDQVLS